MKNINNIKYYQYIKYKIGQLNKIINKINNLNKNDIIFEEFDDTRPYKLQRNIDIGGNTIKTDNQTYDNAVNMCNNMSNCVGFVSKSDLYGNNMSDIVTFVSNDTNIIKSSGMMYNQKKIEPKNPVRGDRGTCGVLEWFKSPFGCIEKWFNGEIFNTMKNIFDSLKDFFNGEFVTFLNKVGKQIINGFETAICGMVSAITSIFNKLKNPILSTIDALVTGVSYITTFIDKLLESLKVNINNIVAKFQEFALNLLKPIKDIFTTIKNKLQELIQKIFEKQSLLLSNIISTINNNITDIKNVLNNSLNFIEQLLGTILKLSSEVGLVFILCPIAILILSLILFILVIFL